MGGQSSKIEDTLDLSSCEAECRGITSRVINTIAVGYGVQSLSLDSLKELTDSFCKTNQTVAKFILLNKKRILNDNDLSDLVKGYFNNSHEILGLCNVLQGCLYHARDSQMTIELAILQFEREQREGFNGKRNIYSSTLQELKKFKAAGDPFTKQFSLMIETVIGKQKSMLKKLDDIKSKRDKKGKKRNFCWFLSKAISVAISAVVVICSIVGKVIGSWKFEAVAGAADAVKPWVDGWMESENEWKGQTETIDLLREKTEVSILDLDNIQLHVDKLKIMIGSLMKNADFARTNDEAVMLAIGEMKKKLSQFTQTIDNLSKFTDDCFDHITMGRKEIMDTIFIHGKKSNK